MFLQGDHSHNHLPALCPVTYIESISNVSAGMHEGYVGILKLITVNSSESLAATYTFATHANESQ